MGGKKTIRFRNHPVKRSERRPRGGAPSCPEKKEQDGRKQRFVSKRPGKDKHRAGQCVRNCALRYTITGKSASNIEPFKLKQRPQSNLAGVWNCPWFCHGTTGGKAATKKSERKKQGPRKKQRCFGLAGSTEKAKRCFLWGEGPGGGSGSKGFLSGAESKKEKTSAAGREKKCT